MSEEHSCSDAVCSRKCISYDSHVKFDVRHHKKRGEHVIDIAGAVQIPDMMIHTTYFKDCTGN
jgi:hypothetical protein